VGTTARRARRVRGGRAEPLRARWELDERLGSAAPGQFRWRPGPRRRLDGRVRRARDGATGAGAGALLLAGSRPDADSPERRAGRADTIRLIEEEGAAGLWENQRPKLFADEAPESAIDLARELTLARGQDELVRAIGAIRDRQDNSGLLASLEVPLVFANGASDLFFPVDEARRFANEARNGRQVVFDRSRHLPSLEQPAEFNQTLLELLQEAG
jgi:pimeloyl-ACP methyl ester carboxylesterase